MTPATFFALLIVLSGALAGLLFFLSAIRPRALFSWRVLCLLTAAIAWYCGGLWGGQLLTWWVISPEFGRPALGLALAALAWYGLALPAPVAKHDH